jgi:2-isopropylmalate synthase
MKKGRELFQEASFTVQSSGDLRRSGKSIATVKIIGLNSSGPFIDAAEGVGPVDALSKALFKVIEMIYPGAQEVEVVDYRVDFLKGSGKGAAGAVRVKMTFRRNGKIHRSTHQSVNVIEASWKALLDGYAAMLNG